MSGLKRACPKCGANYFGWALANPSKRKCERCGSALEITESGVVQNNISDKVQW